MSFSTRFHAGAAALSLLLLAACAHPLAPPDWAAQMSGARWVLMGEVHDSAEQHRLRAQALRQALRAGWRPALLMEQFDRERQPDIERARRERPADAAYLIAQAGGDKAGWHWDFYRPFVELALEFDLPLVAANLSRADAGRITRDGYEAVFDPAQQQALGLARPVDADLQAAQEREIDAGHCKALPPRLWPAMARAQFARDAVMASLLRQQGGRGAVLLAGNGHVRRDTGVPRWLTEGERANSLVLGYLEAAPATPSAFDAVVLTAAVARPDPCAGFKAPVLPSPP
jgi:uncharacterized iron-regulated protein